MIDITQVLPDWDFVGGSVQSRTFQLTRPEGTEYNIQSGIAYCTLQEYVNGGTVLTKQAGISPAESGNFCVATISLSSDDTKDLGGCYTYQITVRDGNGNVAIPFHGRMHITKNIAPELLA